MSEINSNQSPLSVTEIRKIYAMVPYRDVETTVNYIDFANAVAAAAFARGVAAGQEAMQWEIDEVLKDRVALAVQVNELRAKLRALEEQKPVTYGYRFKGGQINDCLADPVPQGDYTIPLYLAAGAKP